MTKIIKRISNRVYPERICLQCLKSFIGTDARQTFCRGQHRIDYHNDQRKIKYAPMKKITAQLLKNEAILKKIFELVEKNKIEKTFNITLLQYEEYDFEIYYQRGINPETKREIEWFFCYGLEVADVKDQTFIIHKKDFSL